MKRIRVAILGAGGLGSSCAKILGMKKEMRLVAICDSKRFAYSEEGLDTEKIADGQLSSAFAEELLASASADSPPKPLPSSTFEGRRRTTINYQLSEDTIGEIIKLKNRIDGIFVALPNLPNGFIPNVTRRFIKAGYSGVFTDALKRTRAVELMFKLDKGLKKNRSVYITGCGATPGLLSAAAVLAAQSFIKVEDVNIWWGVGISNWDEYKATIREDIAHLPGYTVEKAKKMTDEEVEALLDKTDGILRLQEMEHADDILLEKAGVVDSRKKVHVGGVMDTRHAKKPVSSTMTLTGITFDGKHSSHRFILGDETTMAANVIGPALGYLKRAIWLKEHKIYGMFGSTEFMPMVVK